jgi:hypothetical protein
MKAAVGRAAIAAIALAGAALCGAAHAQTPRGALEMQALEPQRLQPGECGMFLWTRAAEARDRMLVAVAFDGPPMLRVKLGDRTVTLPRTAFGRERQASQFEMQRYTDGDAMIEVNVKFDATRPLQDGALVSEGMIKVRSRQGWETLTPVGGLAACQARAQGAPR